MTGKSFKVLAITALTISLLLECAGHGLMQELTLDIKINEVLYYENPESSQEERQHEWVEVYNAGMEDHSLYKWILTNRDGTLIATLPDITLPHGAYLVVHFATGVNDLDFSDGKGDFYAQAVTQAVPVFSDIMDEVGLYHESPSSKTIVDFISWEGTGGKYTGGTAYDHAVDAEIWESGTYFDAFNSQPGPTFKKKTVYPGESIGRDRDSTDTDSPDDWDIKGGPDAYDNTPREQNYHPLNIQKKGPIPPPPPSGSEWTFMVYIDGDNNLESFAFLDMNEMEKAASSSWVNIVIMVNGYNRLQEVDEFRVPVPGRKKGGAWRGQLYHDSDDTIVYLHPTFKDYINQTYYLGEPNMGDPNTLEEFVQWGMANFDAKKYALIIWGPGGGWKAIAVDETSGDDWIHMGELKKALANVSVDLIGFDACLMSMIEVGYQVKGNGKVMVASEEVEDGNGWPYHTILSDLVDDPIMDEKELGKVIVNCYSRFYTGIDQDPFTGNRIIDPFHTLSAIDLGADFETLVEDVSAFGDEMMMGLEDPDTHGDPEDNEQIDIRNARRKTEEYDDVNYVDLYDLTDKIEKSSLKPAYKTKTEDIKDRLKEGGPILLEEKHGSKHENTHGLSIYFPRYQTKYGLGQPFDNPWPSYRDISGSPQVIYAEDFTTEWGKVPYIESPPHPLGGTPNFDFPKDTLWDEFLHRYYKPVADIAVWVLKDEAWEQVEQPIVISLGAIVKLDGSGSSDSDGQVTKWIWDLHSERDEPPGLPQPDHECGSTNDDWECDRKDETNDDRELEGKTVTFQCNEPVYIVTLTVHDNHNNQHSNHWKTDQYTKEIRCTCMEEEKDILPRVYSTYTLLNDNTVELYIRVVDDAYSSLIYDIEIFIDAQEPTWERVEGIWAPDDWYYEPICKSGVRFYTETSPLIKCQRKRFVFRVWARRISWYIRVHVTDRDHENLGEVISIRGWLYRV